MATLLAVRRVVKRAFKRARSLTIVRRARFSSQSNKHLRLSAIAPSVVKAQYAVRGAIVIRAGEIKADLQHKRGSYPYDKVIMCNIGNPQALRQQPLTFHRQVLAELLSPTTQNPL